MKEGGAENRFRILQYEGCKTNKAVSFMQPGCLLKPTPHHVIPGRLCQPDLGVVQWRLYMLLAERDVFTSSTACSVWCAACGWANTVSNRRCLCKSEEHDWVDQTVGVGRGWMAIERFSGKGGLGFYCRVWLCRGWQKLVERAEEFKRGRKLKSKERNWS